MVFDKATTDDFETLVELRKAYLIEDYGGLSEEQIALLNKQLPDYFAGHLDKDLFVYTAREDNRIVSCCFLLVIEKPANPSFINGLTGTVLNVYTRPEYRHKGCAYTLVKNMLTDAENMGLDFAELKSTEAGYFLYSKLGFKEEVQSYKSMKFVFGE